MQLDALGGNDVAENLAMNDQRARFDVGLEAGSLADDQRATRADLALELAIHAQDPLETQRPLELNLFTKKGIQCCILPMVSVPAIR